MGAFRAAIAENLVQAKLLAELIEAEPSLELLAPVELSAVCFRFVNGSGDDEALNELNDMILGAVNSAGHVWLSNASVRGVVGLRACITNHRTTEQDVRAIVSEVLTAADRTAARG